MNVYLLYYLVATILLLLLLKNYHQNLLALLIVLMSFSGTIAYWVPRGVQLMNIVTLILGFYLFIQKQVWRIFPNVQYLILAFGVFSLYFILDNSLVHNDSLLFVLSQYSKYCVPFICLLLFIYYARKDVVYVRYFNQIIGLVLLIQICVSMYKYILFEGHFWEGMVGTFGGVKGGGTGTSFPLVALCWVAINSNMDIRNWKSWLFIAGLLLVGIATGKRAVILLFPILFLVLSVYVCKKKYSNRVWIVIAAAPLLFYLGVRLTPTFNPENKVWGSFDLEYMMNYTENYAMGKVEDGEEREHYTGRVGSALLFWNVLIDIDNYSSSTLLGNGVEKAYSSSIDREAYNNYGREFGLKHRGDITGVLMLHIAVGIVGVILFVIYYWFLFRLIPYKRLRVVLFMLVMFDFIFYNSTMNRDPFISMLLMFNIVYSLVQYSPKGRYAGETHSFFLK